MYAHRMLFVLGALWAAPLVAAWSNCDKLSLLFRGVPEKPSQGKSYKLSYSLINKSGQAMNSVAVAIQFASGITFNRASQPKGMAAPVHSSAGNTVTWSSSSSNIAPRSLKFAVDTTVRPGVWGEGSI